jgi:large-conductance mechanosensitive channel
VVKGINRLSAKEAEKKPPAPPEDVQLLTEIRDLLKADPAHGER